MTALDPPTIIGADSIRYVQVEKETPYALLWPANNKLNLWVRWDEKKVSPQWPYPSCRARFNVVLTGTRTPDGSWQGAATSSWTDSCVIQSATFSLTEQADTALAGWLSLAWTTNCGESSVSLPLMLARQP